MGKDKEQPDERQTPARLLGTASALARFKSACEVVATLLESLELPEIKVPLDKSRIMGLERFEAWYSELVQTQSVLEGLAKAKKPDTPRLAKRTRQADTVSGSAKK